MSVQPIQDWEFYKAKALHELSAYRNLHWAVVTGEASGDEFVSQLIVVALDKVIIDLGLDD